MQIQKLPDSVIDQIAAGEVLERPANLVKELVENSLDAESTEIQISISEGGRKLTVVDNGTGIEKESLSKVFERHATSKISDFSDLWKLQTFGFRGEALASAASVSRITVTSRAKGKDKAHTITSEFGKLSDINTTSSEPGTTIEVSELFANVPARLKFLKSDSAEVMAIKRVLKAIALAHPHTTFWVHIDNELFAYWKSTNDKLKRVEDVLKKNHLNSQMTASGYKADLYFSSPNDVERTSQNQWFFLNNRWIQDKSLQSAVTEAYRHLLMHGEYPSCVVFLDVSPELVDVNVHPAKSQVKFADVKQAFRVVHYGIKNLLETAPWMKKEVATAESEPLNLTFESPATQVTTFQQKPSLTDFSETQRFVTPMQMPTLEDLKTRAQDPLTYVSPPPTEKTVWSSLQVIGQTNLTYILAQSSRALVLVDQHAAHERINFEKLMQAWKGGGKIDTQAMLIPLALDFEASEVEALMKVQDVLARIGIEIEQGGPELIMVSSLPSLIKEDAAFRGLKVLAHELNEYGESFEFDRQIGEIFSTMSCHSSVRAGQALSLEEMKSLLQQMDQFPLSTFCPHGRPVYVEYLFREVEADFGRIV